MILAFDTSNYTTSAALFDGVHMHQARKMIEVKTGERGVRQSDALFAHIKALPELIKQLGDIPAISAVAVSDRPRDIEGSYMPCFLAGESTAASAALILNAPLYRFSHQQGHLAAALWSSDAVHLKDKPFLAWHVSGGTTELLHVESPFKARLIGGSNDLCAGQVIDRFGVSLGLGFPAGAELEKLAEKSKKDLTGKLTVKAAVFSLSGLENQAETFIKNGETPEDTAKFVLTSIGNFLLKATDCARAAYPGLPLIACGGVMSNALIKSIVKADVYAEPEASRDNAAGIAYLGWLSWNH